MSSPAAAPAAAAASPSAADDKSSRFPPWFGPHGESDIQVLNSLTGKTVPFLTMDGNKIKWYTCGPTVYDSAHLGHARCYVTFDIIRRILSDYFKYNVFYVMNITDLDDKIIIRSRRTFLLEQYEKANTAVDPVTADISMAFDASLSKAEAKAAKAQADYREAVIKDKHVDDSKTAAEEEEAKFNMLKSEHAAFKALGAQASIKDLMAAGKGVLSEMLDAAKGESVTDHSISQKHASFYEAEFLEDMRALGVRDADALTRVTEYVQEIVKYVQKIIDNGYAYEAKGSVYFDVAKFTADGYPYAKLSPTAVGNFTLTQSGEGSLSNDLGRKSGQDFALWKTSKKGEPAWSSPWGEGRPGWHIECSAMASDLLGERFDVHSGGTDLKFPHHDNEIAQSEAHGKLHGKDCKQWINHFWHAGHLNIAGLKMSKSLKNFITIRDVLKRHSGRTIRFLFLLTSWHEPMSFSDESLKAATTREQNFNEFFANTAIAVRAGGKIETKPQLWNAEDRELHAKLTAARDAVHKSLQQNFDYPAAMKTLTTLIQDTNKYRQLLAPAEPKVLLLSQIAKYVDSMMRVFGVVPDPEPGFVSVGADDGKLAGVLDAACAFRDAMRDAVRAKRSPAEMLALCDRFRDEAMIDLGVRMEDVTVATPAANAAASSAASSSDASSSSAPAAAASSSSVRSVWKLDDPSKLRRERDEKKSAEGLARLQKLRNKLEKAQKDLAKVQDAAIGPKEFFAAQAQKEKYSTFDAEGKPTHDQAGVELTKSAIKGVAKIWETRDKAFKELAAKIEKNPQLIAEMQKEIADMQQELAAAEAAAGPAAAAK